MTIVVYITHPEVPAWNFSETHLELMQKELPGARITVCSDSEGFVDHLPKAQIACIWYFKNEWLYYTPQLEWIVTPAAGKDYFHIPPSAHIDIDYCSFHGELMGETVLGMMFTHVRGIKDTVLLWQNHQWTKESLGKRMRLLRDSHLVILGFGHIGQWIGKLAKPFGVHITGVNRTNIEFPSYFDKADAVIPVEELDSVLPRADHLVLALPGGEETTDIIGEKQISLLPPQAVIYNIGRGNAISESALVTALKENRIEAAYLDVTKEEPVPPDSPLMGCPNLVVMPHASAIGPRYLDLFVKEFAEKYRKRYKK
jgi:D-2-hydroxyacid dehydrogenase (NADP+)